MNNEKLIKLPKQVEEITEQLDSIVQQKLDKNGIVSMANMGQDVKEAMTGGSVAVVGRDTVLTENIVDNQVVPHKTNFFTDTHNKFNPYTVTKNAYINSSGDIGVGQLTVSDFIAIGNTNLRCGNRNNLSVGIDVYFYTDTTYISKTTIYPFYNYKSVVPLNATRIRTTFNPASLNDTDVFIYFSEKELPFKQYKVLNNESTGLNVKTYDSAYFKPTYNVLNPYTVMLDKYVNTSGGVANSGNWITTPMMDLISNNIKVCYRTSLSKSTKICFYDINDVYISAISIYEGYDYSSQIPPNAKKFRVGIEKANYSQWDVCIYFSDTVKPYIPYLVLDNEVIDLIGNPTFDKASKNLDRINDTYTSHYDYINNAIRDCTSKLIQKDGDFKFAFMSDIHQTNNDYRFDILGKLNATGIFNCVVNGGDTLNEYDTRGNCIKAMNRVFAKHKQVTVCENFILEGNHDTNASTEGNTSTGAIQQDRVISKKQWHDLACKHLEEKVVFDVNNPYGGYYYKDYPRQKIRVIVMNNADVIDDNGVALTSLYNTGMSQKQIDWLKNVALNFNSKSDKSEWCVLPMGHGYSVAELYILDAFRKGIRVTGRDTWNSTGTLVYDCDFTSQGVMELCPLVSGHMHYDRYRTDLNIPIIYVNTAGGTPDGTYEGYVQPPRTPNTITNECADLFSIDRKNRKIYSVRFGVGDDRVFSY